VKNEPTATRRSIEQYDEGGRREPLGQKLASGFLGKHRVNDRSLQIDTRVVHADVRTMSRQQVRVSSPQSASSTRDQNHAPF
jgi:hypothetical protein